MPRVSIDGQELPRVLRATVTVTHNVPGTDPLPPAQGASHHAHPDLWKQAAGDALAQAAPLLMPGRHSPPASALGDVLKLGPAAHESAKSSTAPSALPAARQRPPDPLQTPRAEFVLLLPLAHDVDIARWALAPMGPGRFHRITLQTLDRFGTPKHTWVMFRAYVHAYREAEYTPRPTDPADGRRYVEVTLRGLLPPLTDYDGQNLVVVAPGQADQSAEAALQPIDRSLLQTMSATRTLGDQIQSGTPQGGQTQTKDGAAAAKTVSGTMSLSPQVVPESSRNERPYHPPPDDPCHDCQLCVKVLPGPKDTYPHNSNTHQIIDNFGASDAWCFAQLDADWDVKPKNSSSTYREALADLLFNFRDFGGRGDGTSPNGIGLSLWRFNVGAGRPTPDENGNYLFPTWTQTKCFYDSLADLKKPIPPSSDGQKWQQSFLSSAYRKGVRQFVAFVNSPPCWLTVNGLPYTSTDSAQPHPETTNLRMDHVDDFASFLIHVVQHLQSITRGADWYISPLNEPDNPWDDYKQEGCRYSTADIKKVLKVLGPKIKQLPRVQIIGPEANNLKHLLDWVSADHDDSGQGRGPTGKAIYSSPQKYGNYIHELLGDDRIKGFLNNRLAAHDYGNDYRPGSSEDVRRRIRQAMDAVNPVARYWMSEYAINGGGGDLPLKIMPGVNRSLGSNALGQAHYIDNTKVTSSPDDGSGLRQSDVELANMELANMAAALGPAEARQAARIIRRSGEPPSGIAAAIQLASLMHQDLTLANASAWHWWTAVSHRPDHSALIHTTYNPPKNADTFGPRQLPPDYLVDYALDETPTILPTKMLWAFGNYSRFVRPGATRVGVSLNGKDSGVKAVLASAYSNDLSQDSHAPVLVVVLINPSKDKPVTLKNLCNDLDAKWTHYYVTSSTENLKHYYVKDDTIMLPAYSVVTLTS